MKLIPCLLHGYPTKWTVK